MAAVAPSSSTAAPTASPSSSTSRLEPLLLVARSTKPRGAAAANLIHQAISAPGVYFFGELFDVPGVAELSRSTESQLSTAYQLLTLFAYGTCSDYAALSHPGSLPDLSRDQIQKLRQLTLLSLARQNKLLPYAALHGSLGIDSRSTRELEDLIIESIYAGLISGKLNELRARFEVHHVQGRDVPHPSLLAQPAVSALTSLTSNTSASQLDQMLSSLQAWQSTTVSALEGLQARMEDVKSSAASIDNQRQEHHSALLQNLVEVQQEMEAQQQKQASRKGKGAAGNAMEIDDETMSRGGARKKAAVGGVRGNKRSRP
ncbi:related to cop9 signalosome complex subunit 7a [Ustilago sp. UG-2017b]|nr:related to cop9 signalosome complex subunit 7a [Ustilago sp. UG-2017b]